ncbi:MAG: hypothetical protein AB1403_06930, partial [Candidatus Riflebacteria bacterium]
PKASDTNKQKDKTEKKESDKTGKNDDSTSVYLIIGGIVVLALLAAYAALPTCPKCNSKKCTKLNTVEKDRYLGAKTVALKNGKGEKIGETSITVTYVIYLHMYQCNLCSTKFLVEEKKELE